MDTKTALYFREKFRGAREAAQRDAENFDSIVFVLEKLGSFLAKGKGVGLAAFKNDLMQLARACRELFLRKGLYFVNTRVQQAWDGQENDPQNALLSDRCE